MSDPKIVRPPPTSRATQQYIEANAPKAAEALLKMEPNTRDAIMDAIPKTFSQIKSSIQHRMLGRSTEQLARRIGGTEAGIDVLTQTAGKVGDLVEGFRQESRRDAGAALAQIALAAGVTDLDFAKLTARLRLIALAKDQQGLANLTAPQKAVLSRVGGPDFAKLVESVQQQLEGMAYRPLLDLVDAPKP